MGKERNNNTHDDAMRGIEPGSLALAFTFKGL